MTRRAERNREVALEKAKGRIAERLQAVCADLSADEFDELCTQMATIEIKYLMRRGEDLFPGSGDAVVNDPGTTSADC